MERMNVRTTETIENIPKTRQTEEMNSLQIKLNIRDADMSRLENLLIEMHKKMDDVKCEAAEAKIVAGEAEQAQQSASF